MCLENKHAVSLTMKLKEYTLLVIEDIINTFNRTEVTIMPNKKMDPRVIKTRTNLRKALVFLMQNEKIENISVQKITETAHITRGTFYLHYKDKNDFVKKAMEEIIDEFFDSVMISSSSLVLGKKVRVLSLNKAFAYIEKNSDIFTILLERSQDNNFYRQMYSRFEDELTDFAKEVKPDMDDLEVPLRIQIAYIASAILGLIAEWLNDGLVYTSRYMTASVSKLLNHYSDDNLLLTSFFDDEIERGIKL